MKRGRREKLGLLGGGSEEHMGRDRGLKNNSVSDTHTHTRTHAHRMLKLVELSPCAVGSSVRLSVSYCIPDNSLSCFSLSPAHQKVEQFSH